MSQARVNQWWSTGFTADTPVLMADGKRKPISKIKEGDIVISFDPDTLKIEPGLVTKTWSSVMSDTLEVEIDNKKMIVANEQRFFTPEKKFKTAPDTSAVLAEDGTVKKLSAKKIPGKVKIYDITVQDKHSFFADGLMVHNGGGSKKTTTIVKEPDPVVTAGKIGRPLTVTVNGNTITVPPSPGSSAQVSVTSRGAVSTGYASAPGVAPLWPVQPLPRRPRVPAPWVPRNNINDAIAIRDYVCKEMVGFTGRPTRDLVGPQRGTWISNLEQMRRIVADARRSSRGVWDRPGRNPTEYTNWINGGSTDLTTAYDDALRNIEDLTRYVQKNKNLTSKDSSFIAGLCSQIESNFNKITGRLTNVIVSPPCPLPLPNAEYINERVYIGEPRYPYFMLQPGKQNSYVYAPPNTTPGGNYIKSFDPDRGLDYYQAGISLGDFLVPGSTTSQ